ncbi:rod shape-determining protein MreC [Acrocarpospora phusangensis]|uniref:Cell shape-determining protein MreC n=1 Tax=Acrocarpospora phusangensis TaxID=1070424 RepID=A0A919UU30_9ACTN|nr:rod shape-determining protein MreC [Acrocarpospora phusangensis]GIH28025.1 rod shape-determining protein MreC [Acrocarpospora phusangensis]
MKDTRRARIVMGTLLATALVLITVDHRSGNSPVLGPVRGFTAGVFGAAERATVSVTEPVGSFFKSLAGASSAQRRIDELSRENGRLRGELTAQRLDKQRSAQLAGMLGLSGRGGYRVVPAQVIARRSAPGFEDAVEIDAGARDGIRREMTVLNAQGLVGRVVQAAEHTATVVLLSDPASSAGARLEGGNELGVVSGLGENGSDGRFIRFRLLDSSAPLTVGHRIVSFGSLRGTPYVAGVPIGVIERVEATPGELTRTAYARPFADLTSLDVVGVVVQGPARPPRDSVLPGGRPDPQPRPSPKPSKPNDPAV